MQLCPTVLASNHNVIACDRPVRDNSICIFFQNPWGLNVLVPKKEKREAEAEAKPYYGYGYGVPLVAVETIELEPCKVILNQRVIIS